MDARIKQDLVRKACDDVGAALARVTSLTDSPMDAAVVAAAGGLAGITMQAYSHLSRSPAGRAAPPAVLLGMVSALLREQFDVLEKEIPTLLAAMRAAR